LLGRTKDLRVAVRLAEAAANRQGIAGFSEGLRLVQGLIDRHWAALHPELDPEDGNDPTMRFNALAALSTQSVIGALRAAPLLTSRSLGPASLADFGIDPSGKADAANVDAAKLQAGFTESDLPALEAVLGAIVNSQTAVAAIDASLQTLAGSQGPDFSGLTRILFQARQGVEPRVLQRRADEAGPEAQPAGGPGAPEARAQRGDILSREDVVRTLDKICGYYERHEPSSPVPLLLQRAKKLVTLNFVDILKDLAPDGMKQIEMVAGKRDKEE
jgi:type VI secretion system protein ImpA